MPWARPIRPTTRSTGLARLVDVEEVDAHAAAAVRAPTTVRSARAVRPPRPMTLPRSSGCTRTSRTRPRRRDRSSTRTSSGCSTIPCTRWSSASSSIRPARCSRPASRRRSRRPRSPRRSRPAPRREPRRGPRPPRAAPPERRPPWPPWPRASLGASLRASLGALAFGVTASATGSEAAAFAAASNTAFLSAFGAAMRRVPSVPGRPLNFCQSPVILRIASDRLGRLRADAQPVLRPLGVDLDERGVLHRVVLADLLDRAAVPLGARVGDDDAVLRGAHLAQALELDLDSHEAFVSWCRCG